MSLTLAGRPVSLPYVEMTLRTMKAFGASFETRMPGHRYDVRPGCYEPREYDVEGDHSSASYFLAIPAVLGRGRVRVAGVRPESAQPDAVLGRILESSGLTVRRGTDWVEVLADRPPRALDIDVSQSPDLAPTLAVIAAFAGGPSTIRGLAHLRLKESDRLAALEENLPRIGARATVVGDTLHVDPSPGSPQPASEISTRSDHRIAMAFAVAGLRVGVGIDDAECVAKSNPRFWECLGDVREGRARTGS